ncbi:MAG: FK506 binding protein proline rotamase rapamycin-binding protein [Geoglossum simile]|nr:MAG: FK506 binding protein proline rotamase rapamycin-binding protein [Geoglossum simile]
MGVEKLLLRAGDTTKKPTKGDTVEIEYTGWLYDEYAVDGKGKQFDTSKDRVDFVTEIGEGTVIKGWETLSAFRDPLTIYKIRLLTPVTLLGISHMARGKALVGIDLRWLLEILRGAGADEAAIVVSRAIFLRNVHCEVKLKGIKRKDTEVWERAKTAT